MTLRGSRPARLPAPYSSNLLRIFFLLQVSLESYFPQRIPCRWRHGHSLPLRACDKTKQRSGLGGGEEEEDGWRRSSGREGGEMERGNDGRPEEEQEL